MERRGGGAAPAELELELPGFRFHPTEEELLEFYLKQVAHGKELKFDIISTVHLYRHDPWELPGLARIAGAEREWYFFVPRDHRKQHGGGRTSRTTERGFWKATGSDRAVRCAGDPKRLIGLKKTLVYYEGRAPRGSRTDWVMNEYRLPNKEEEEEEESVGVVLCKVYRKAVSLKELEQRAAMEELACAATATPSSASHNSTGSGSGSPADSAISSSSDVQAAVEMKKEAVVRPAALMSLPQLEVARQPPQQMAEWMQDPFLTQLRSPWMESWSPYYGASSALNF